MIKTPNGTIVNTSVDPGLNYLSQRDVREIKNMNLKFMSMGKGLLIGFAVMVAADIGIGEIIMKLL